MSGRTATDEESAQVSMCVFCTKDLPTRPTVMLDKNMLNEYATMSMYLKDMMHVTFNYHKFLKVHKACEKRYRTKAFRAIIRIKNKERKKRDDMLKKFDLRKHCIFCAKVANRSPRAKKLVCELMKQSTLDEVKEHLKNVSETNRTDDYDFARVRAHAIRPITDQSIKPLYHVDCMKAVGMTITDSSM